MAMAPGYEAARPLRRSEYEQLVRLGAFDGEELELLDGVLVPKMTIGPSHSAAIQALMERSVEALRGRATVRVQQPLAAGELSMPEPDLALVPRGDHRDAHPDVASLVVEVAESSPSRDRTDKQRICAASGVPESWSENLVDRCIEVYTEPAGTSYRSVRVHALGTSLRVGAFADVAIAVSDVVG